jgi:hypothetical protein
LQATKTPWFAGIICSVFNHILRPVVRGYLVAKQAYHDFLCRIKPKGEGIPKIKRRGQGSSPVRPYINCKPLGFTQDSKAGRQGYHNLNKCILQGIGGGGRNINLLLGIQIRSQETPKLLI